MPSAHEASGLAKGPAGILGEKPALSDPRNHIDVRNQKMWRTMGPPIDFGLHLGQLLVLAGELQPRRLVQFSAYVVRDQYLLISERVHHTAFEARLVPCPTCQTVGQSSFDQEH